MFSNYAWPVGALSHRRVMVSGGGARLVRLCVVCVAAIAVSFSAVPLAGAASASRPQSDSAASGAPARWVTQTAPAPPAALNSVLASVSCTKGFCMAVGATSIAGGKMTALSERWNGVVWSIVTAAPNPTGTTGTELRSVSCTSATACIAVGDAVLAKSGTAAIAESYNGTRWTPMTNPLPKGSSGTVLRGVSCVSAAACMAVGTAASSVSAGQSLAEWWNGAKWTSLALLEHPAGMIGSGLLAVSCVSKSFCVVAGISLKIPTGTAPMLASWNGKAWSVPLAPDTSSKSSGSMNGVSCRSIRACTAVGSLRTSWLIERWNGRTWVVQTATAPPGSHGMSLNGVSCTTTTQCTAVGTNVKAAGSATLAAVWNGAKWVVQVTTNPGGSGNALLGLSCSAPAACTAVGGKTSGATTAPLAERYG